MSEKLLIKAYMVNMVFNSHGMIHDLIDDVGKKIN